MSDLAVSDDLRGPVFKPDLSGGLGSALAGTLEKELPKAIQADDESRAMQRKAAGSLISEIDSASQRRRDAPKPALPPPAPPPQFEATSPAQQWGSMAMGMAMLGSAFTKRPAINALNAAAGVMNAYHDKDQEAYKRNFDHWKATSDYSLKMYEYQREAYRDALSDIDKDVTGAMQKFRIVAEAFKDDKMAQFAKIGNAAAVIQTLKMGDFQYEKAKEEGEKLKQEGDLRRRGMEAAQRLQKDPNDEDAKAELGLVTQMSQILHLVNTGQTGPTQHFEAPHEYIIKDQDGKIVRSVMGRVSTSDPAHVFDDQGQPVQVQPGQQIHAAAPGEGKQAATQIQSLVGATSELTPALRNLTRLPITSRLGVTMGLENLPPEKMADAIGRSLARELTPGQSTAVQQMFAGVNRNLATIEAQGARQGLIALQKSSDILVPKSGWTGFTVARSYAEIRQIVEANARTMQASPYVSDSQKKLLSDLLQEVQQAVPWTVQDVNDADPSTTTYGKKGRRESVRDFADRLISAQAPAAKYTVGQVIDRGGKKYRVTGGDMNDPDVETVP